MDFSKFAALTFDCYGTLIDWETGILGALRPVLDYHGVILPDAVLLQHFGLFESALESEAYLPYHEVLCRVLERFAETFGFLLEAGERTALADSLPNWSPFQDTVPALRALSKRFQLAVVSNTDDDLFAKTRLHLENGFVFTHVITAQQAGCYKPCHRMFALAQERIGVPKERILHVGQSVYHDIAPAKELGMTSVLVSRRGHGAARPAEAEPDLMVPDMQALAQITLA